VPRQVRLISVLILAFVFASVACLGLYLSRQQLHSRLQSEALRLQSAFAVAQSDIEQNMLILAAMVAADPEVQRLFRDGKAAVQAEGGGPGGERARRARQALMDHVAPQWRSMQAQFALRQLHFHLGPGSLSFCGCTPLKNSGTGWMMCATSLLRSIRMDSRAPALKPDVFIPGCGAWWRCGMSRPPAGR